MTNHLQADQASTQAAKAARNLGALLCSAREVRGLKVSDAAREAHVPIKYLAMLEGNDYSKIADELYLLPFLRSYSEFLGLDAEAMSMRFIGEVQRAEALAPVPEIKPERHGVRGNWLTTVAVVFFVVLALYLVGIR